MHEESSAANPTPAKDFTPEKLRFGPFEVDRRSGELRKSGVKIKLHAQPFEVLVMLLERAGEVVTREEIQRRLWAADTFVDFERGLNKAINKVRDALGDDADDPRFIETLPRRGYRFIAAVTEPEPAQMPEPTKPPEQQEQSPPRRTGIRMWAVVVAAAMVAGMLAATVWWLRAPEPAPRVLGYRQLTSDRAKKGEGCGYHRSRLVTDGTRVFFSETGSEIMQVSVNGGEATRVANPLPCFFIFDISPDKTELLGAQVTSDAPDQPLWVLSTVSGLARRLGDLRAHAADWSPDSRTIAYATADAWDSSTNDLSVAPRDGKEGKKIATIQGTVTAVLWSKDGQSIRGGTRSAPCVLWEVADDGSNLHRIELTNMDLQGYCETGGMTWDPDNKYLAFGVNGPFSLGGGIWALRGPRSGFRKDTGEAIQLSSGPMEFGDPAFSPDGRQIFAIGGRRRGELVELDRKTRKLEPFLSGISAEHLDFTRDGKWVAYVTYPEGSLWRSRVDGSERMQLTAPPFRAALPRWSPDGTRIVFTGFAPDAFGRIFMVPAEGGKPELVATPPGAIAADPTWLPDGNSLVFGGGMFASRKDIWKLDLRTGVIAEIPGSQNLFSPRVSPDGRYIVAVGTRERKLMLFDQNKGTWSELLRGKDTGWPSWSNDSRSIYFLETTGGLNSVERVGIADRKVKRIEIPHTPAGLIGVFGPWVGVTPDGSPLMVRDLSVQEIYALDVDLP